MKFRKKLVCFLLAWVLCLAGCELPEQTQTDAPTQPADTQYTQAPTQEPTQEPTGAPTQEPTRDPGQETTEPVPTQPPVTEPPATQPPATEPPAPTQPPVTEPPVTQPPVTEPPVTEQPTTQPDEQGGIPNTVTVVASGVLVKSNEQAIIDYSNTKDGYVMIRYIKATSQKLKAKIQGPSTTYYYDLTPQKWAAFPLSDENGSYKITVYKNVSGSSYAAVLTQTVNVTMTDEFAPFLRSNQYVDFDAAPKAVAKAAQLTAGITDPLKKVEKVYDFVVGGMTYDYDLANRVTSGYLPVLDDVLQKMKGICFDYAALMTGMLRSQGVPTKLVVGYAGDVYHAWISVWSESTGWVDGTIYFDGTSWKRMDPTFASSGGSSPDIMDYIGTGSNYTAKYFY